MVFDLNIGESSSPKSSKTIIYIVGGAIVIGGLIYLISKFAEGSSSGSANPLPAVTFSIKSPSGVDITTISPGVSFCASAVVENAPLGAKLIAEDYVNDIFANTTDLSAVSFTSPCVPWGSNYASGSVVKYVLRLVDSNRNTLDTSEVTINVL